MTENRDPKTCPECETVNAWNAETCRTCNRPLPQAAEPSVPPEPTPTDSADSGDSPPKRPSLPSLEPLRRLSGSFGRRRWNVFWIMLGIGIHVVSIHFGVFVIIKYLIEPDPELKARLEQTIESVNVSGDGEEVDIAAGASEEVKDKLSTIRFLVITLILFVPLLIGLLIGFFSKGILEGAASMGLSAVLIPLLNNAAVYAVFWGPLNSGLGALGAFLGYRLGQHVKRA